MHSVQRLLLALASEPSARSPFDANPPGQKLPVPPVILRKSVSYGTPSRCRAKISKSALTIRKGERSGRFEGAP